MSWCIALLMAAEDGLQFGSEIVFTYGPLAFLGTPLYMYHGSWLASLFFCFSVHFLFVALVVYFVAPLSGKKTPGSIALFLSATLIAILTIPLVPAQDRLLLMAAMLLYLAHHEVTPVSPLFKCVGAGIFIAIVSLGKMSCFYIGITMMLVFVALEARRRQWTYVVSLSLGYIVTLALGWFATGQDLKGVGGFIRYGWEISHGYNDAMALQGPAAETALGVLCLVLLTLLFFMSWFLRNRSAVFMGLTWFYYLANFKLGFVRHDSHAAGFFIFSTLYLTLVACCGIVVARLRWNKLAAIGLLVLFLSGAGMVVSYNGMLLTERPLYAQIQEGTIRDAWRLIRNRAFRGAYVESAKNAMLHIYGLEPGTLGRLVGADTVDILPWETGIAWAADLNWRPRPVFQSYSAYTAALDELNARSLERERGPEWVLWHWSKQSIDGRYALFDEPSTLRTLLCNYRLVESYNLRGRYSHLLALKRSNGTCGESVPLGSIRSKLNTPIPIPEYDEGYVFGRIITHQTLLGKLKSLLIRPGLLEIVFPEAGESFRLNRGVTENGIILGAYARTAEEFADLFSDQAPRQLSMFAVGKRFDGWNLPDWGEDYRPEIEVEFFGIPRSMKQSGRTAEEKAAPVTVRTR
jgi:hypothetical protein